MRQGAGRLSTYQLTAVVASVTMGHRVITIARTATANAREAGWVAVVLAAALALVGAWAGWRLSRRFPGWPLGQVLRHLLGRPLALGVAAVLAGFWWLQGALAAREYAEVVSVTALFRTPVWVTAGGILLCAAVALGHDLRVLGRVNEVYWAYAALALLVGAVASLPYARLDRLLPWYGGGPGGLAASTATTFGDFAGFSTALVFFPYLLRPQAGFLAAARGIGLAALVFLVLVVTATAALGTHVLPDLAWPTLTLVKMQRIPGRLLERMDSLFISVGVTAIFATSATYLFAAALLLQQVLGLRSHVPVGLALAAAGLVAGMAPPGLEDLFQWLHHLDLLIWFCGLALPFTLLALAWLRPPPGRAKGP